MRILVADDEERVRSAIILLLQQHLVSADFYEASTIAETQNYAQNYTFDIILLDWELSKNKGDLLVNHLHTLQPYAIIIALSGRPEMREIALYAGADVFVSKGDPPEYLLAAIIDSTSLSQREPRKNSQKLHTLRANIPLLMV